jgi:hypothetical protein
MKKQRKRDKKSFRKEIKKKTSNQKSGFQFQPHPLLPIVNELKTFSTDKFLTKETWKNVEDLRYIISTDNIPLEIKEKVKEIIVTKPPRMGQCLWYSKFITSQIKDVNQVLGLFELTHYNELSYLFPKNEIVHFNGTSLVKDDKNTVWGIHSWNEYNGIHFDCLKEGVYDKLEVQNRFIKYKLTLIIHMLI